MRMMIKIIKYFLSIRVYTYQLQAKIIRQKKFNYYYFLSTTKYFVLL
jgi:hypothetical protein